MLQAWTWNWSWLERIFGPSDTTCPCSAEAADRVSHGATLALRLLQVHFALIVFVGALLLQFDWWSGVALVSRMYPPQELTPEKLRDMKAMGGRSASSAWPLHDAGVAARLSALRALPAWRPLLIGGAVLGWLSSLLLTGVPYFA